MIFYNDETYPAKSCHVDLRCANGVALIGRAVYKNCVKIVSVLDSAVCGNRIVSIVKVCGGLLNSGLSDNSKYIKQFRLYYQISPLCLLQSSVILVGVRLVHFEYYSQYTAYMHLQFDSTATFTACYYASILMLYNVIDVFYVLIVNKLYIFAIYY